MRNWFSPAYVACDQMVDEWLHMSATTSTVPNTTSGDAAWIDAVDGPRWRFLPLTVVPLWILVGNSLVLLAVIRQRSLRTLSNSVIASLAFADFLLALLVVPLGVYQLVSSFLFVVVISWFISQWVWTSSPLSIIFIIIVLFRSTSLFSLCFVCMLVIVQVIRFLTVFVAFLKLYPFSIRVWTLVSVILMNA